MAESTPLLDIGKLLRVRAMVIGAAQMEATFNAAGALVRAYRGLRKEMVLALSPDELRDELSELLAEFHRLFQDMEEPPPHNPYMDQVLESSTRLTEAATEAQLNLRRLEGWIQGLIDEQTLEQRMRIDAEEKAKWAAKQPPGFRGDP